MSQHRPLPTQAPTTWMAHQAQVATPSDHRVPEFGRVVVPGALGRSITSDRNGELPAAVRQVSAALYRPLGLRTDPFPRTLPLDAPMPAIAKAAEELADWATSRHTGGSLAIVTGPARSGRTTLLQRMATILAAHLDTPLRVVEVPLGETSLSAGRLLRAIVIATGEAPQGPTSLAMTRQIRHLADGQPMVLILDSVRPLDGSQLDVLRGLLLEETSLRIVVTGTRELVDRIRRRQSLADRLTYRHAIEPLTEDALSAYLHQRIEDATIAGERGAATSFTPEAITHIAAWSEGVIGPSVELAGECLLEAVARGRRIVDATIAHDVMREFIDRERLTARRLADTSRVMPSTQAMLNLSPASPAHEPAPTGGRR